METDVALDLALLTALYALWRRTGSPSDVLDEPPEREMLAKRPQRQEERKRVILLDDSSGSDAEQDESPLKKRPKRLAAKEADERVRQINEYLRREKVMLSRRSDHEKDDDTPQAEGGDDSENASQDPVPADFEVEQVLDERWVGGSRQYLLKWEGDDVPTWEPATNVDNCDGLLADFNQEVDPGFDEDITSD